MGEYGHSLVIGKMNLEGAEKLKSTFQPQPLQSSVAVYKRPELLIYHVTCAVDEETYITEEGAKFYSTEPILPKEHLRMQQLMEREKRIVCLYCISFKDIQSEPKVIRVNRDQNLHLFLLIHKEQNGM